MSRINRTAWGGEKPAPPSLKIVAIRTKNILLSVHMSSFKKGNKTSLAPCSWFLKNEVIYGKASRMRAHPRLCTRVHLPVEERRPAAPLQP